MLIGLQLHAIISSLSGYDAGTLAGYAVAVAGVVIATRLLWFFTIPTSSGRSTADPSNAPATPGQGGVAAWSGLRGAVSLAVALAIPLTTRTGEPFPERNLIIFLTFAVIFFTLVAQGLSLPALIRRLAVSDDSADTEEDTRARLVAATAALRELDELATEDWTRDQTIERLQRFYEYRKTRFAARAGKIEDDGYEDQTLAYQQTLQRLLAAQRDALIQMRSNGNLSNEAMNRILRELDLEESRLEI